MTKLNLYWKTVKASEIEIGNFVSGIYSKNPRLIIKIESYDGMITFYEMDSNGKNSMYRSLPSDAIIDLLMDHNTNKPYEIEV